MAKKIWLLLFLIVLLAFILRFYKLEENPASLSWDEASIGYNAYSISQTLKDEHGNFLPYQYFSAFGDYKPPVSIYLTAISVKIFGLTEWSVRFPSALLGVLTVLLTFFLVEQLRLVFNSKFLTSNPSTSLGTSFSLLTSFFLAISPWHTILSRQMFEANIAQFFIVLGVLFFLKGLERGWYLVLGIISLVTSIYTFNSPRVFVPILLFGWGLFFWRQVRTKIRWGILSLIAGVILFLPLLPHLLSPMGQLRFKEVNIFSDNSVVVKSNERIEVDKNAIWSKILHNRRVGYGLSFLAHYLDHFNIDYLFFRGDINPKFSTRSNGQFFLIEVILLAAGTYFLIKKERKLGFFVFFWLLAGLIPASMARETPHALRTEVSLPMWQIISATGLYYFYNKLYQNWRKIFIMIIFITLFGQFVSYLHNYYIHYPLYFSQDWQYGYKLAAQEITPFADKYDKIWVTEKYGRPYIFFLFYQKYEPQDFQNKREVRIDEFGFYHVEGFDKYIFGALDSNKFKNQKVLLIGTEGEIPDNARKIKDIYFLNGEKALEMAEL